MLMKSKKQMIHEMLASLPDEPAQHYDFGGSIGNPLQTTVNTLSNADSTILNGAASVTPFTKGLAANPTKALTPLTPQDQYTQQAAGQTNYNYGNDIAGGADMANNAYNNLGTNSQLLQNTAGVQASTFGQQQGILAQQQGLAGQLQAEANGSGPNPAQAQYQQNIANNTANTAGTIASEKGLSPALQARLIANTQASGAQNAAGTAATTQAQQQIAAQQQLAAQQQAESGTLNNAVAGQTASANSLADANTGNAAQGTLGINELNAGNTGNNNQNTSSITSQDAANTINANTASSNAAANQKTSGGILNGLGGAVSSLFAKGGEADAPLTKQPARAVAAQASPALSAHLMARGGPIPGTPKVNHNDIKNDVVPAVLSPKEIVLPLDVTQAKDAPARAAAFVEALKKHTQPGYAKVLEARKKLADAHAKYQGGMITV